MLTGSGPITGGTPFALTPSNARENSPAFFALGSARLDLPVLGGVLVPNFSSGALLVLSTDGTGQIVLGGTWPFGQPPGLTLYMQYFIVDPAGPLGVSASNAIALTTP